jgi:hypothetical protein
MEVYQIKVKLKLREKIAYKKSIEVVSENVNKIMYNSLILRELHNSKLFKPYVVGSLGKYENGWFDTNRDYELTIRSIDEGFVEEFKRAY